MHKARENGQVSLPVLLEETQSDDCNSSLRCTVFFADVSAKEVTDISDDDLVIQHYVVKDILVVCEHCVSVTHILEHVVVASNCICCLWIDWLPFAILFNEDILDLSLTFDIDEKSLVILLYRRWNRCSC